MNNPKLKVLCGISGSGKSTYSTQFISTHKNWVRVNRDNIRHGLSGTKANLLSTDLENRVSEIQHEQIRYWLLKGFNVILDNTNLKRKYIDEIKLKYDHLADIEIVFFDCLLETARERVIKRDNLESSQVDYIDRMHAEYTRFRKEYPANVTSYEEPIKVIKPDFIYGKPDCVLCDLDGTLALYGSKNPYDRDFENDYFNAPVMVILKGLPAETKIIFLSGRSDKFRAQTEIFLTKGFTPEEYSLFMRGEEDMRRDSIVKMELFVNNIQGNYNPLFVLDDRLQVIEECWEKLGLFVLNCNQGNKRF